MTAVRSGALSAPRSRLARRDLDGWGASLLGFALVAYVGAQGGGFDVVVRGQVAVALWWIAGLGFAAGVLRARPSRLQAAASAGLLAFAAWTLLSATWSESPERAVSEGARDVTILGAFVLTAVAVRGERVRWLLGGLLAGIAAIAGIAVLSRLQPSLFDDTDLRAFLPTVASRLAYPLNYWNALGALMAMGIPLALGLAVGARRGSLRALALATVPLLALVGYLTVSRAAIGCAVLALLVAFVFGDERARWALKTLLASAGSAILIASAEQRGAIVDGLRDPTAAQQGDELLAVVLVVLVGVGLVALGASYAATAWPALARAVPRPSRRATTAAAAVAIVALSIGAVALGAPSELSDRYERFKDPGYGTNVNTNDPGRLTSASGQGRYQYWEGMVDAFAADPLRGLGAGSFPTYWARTGSIPGKVDNAHSLYFEVLGELGVIGIVALGAFMLTVLGGGAWRTLGAGPDRAVMAGALGAAAAFALSALVDWSWQVTVLPVLLAVLAAALLVRREAATRAPSRALRVVVPVLAVLGIAAVLPSMTAADQLHDSQRAAASGELQQALATARTAERAQPYAFSPLLQQALVLEARGDLDAAAALSMEAERQEPRNWRAPFTLARIEAERGNVDAALAAYRRAAGLNRTGSVVR